MKKIIVLGCPGAGKSTFARRLRDLTGLPLYYLDQIWHKSDRTTVTREEFDAALGGILAQDAWIIDGNYKRTIEPRLAACDTAFLLDYPTEICLAGAAARVGQVREEMPWTEEKLDPEFRQYIVDFAAQQLPQVYALLAQYGEGRHIVIFRTREEADAWLRLYEQSQT
ncbi:MAG: adenylate kinase [Ruminococcaceae bacterium]|nr:adenylate kinase [Oscillospiraceae bacterium]